MKKDILLILGLWLVPGLIEFSAASSPHSKLPQAEPSQIAWMHAEWNGNDKPFTDIRTTVFAAVKHGADPVALATQYAKDVEKKPFDAQTVFRYGYTTYLAALYSPAFAKTGKPVQALFAMGRLSPNDTYHSYEYTRLRFLMETLVGPHGLDLKPLGRKLLILKPHDYQVEYSLVQLLDGGIYPKEKQEGLNLVQDLMKQSPNNSNLYTLQGGIYYITWLTTHSRDDSDNSIAAYEKYRSLVKPSDGMYIQAGKLIKMMQDGQKKWDEKHGTGKN